MHMPERIGPAGLFSLTVVGLEPAFEPSESQHGHQGSYLKGSVEAVRGHGKAVEGQGEAVWRESKVKGRQEGQWKELKGQGRTVETAV